MAGLQSSTGDPDVDAAFGGAATSAAPGPVSTGDPDVDAAFKTTDSKDTKGGAKKPPTLWDRYLGFQESQLAGASGGVASLAGGLSYLGDRVLLQKSDEEAQADRAAIENDLTYTPRTQEGARQTANLSEAARYTGEIPGHYLGAHAADTATALGASPETAGALGAAGEVAGNSLQFLVGSGIDSAGRVLRTNVTGAMDAARAARLPGEAQAAANQAYSAQSMGAAGTAPDVSTASPPLQQAIKEAGPDLNPDVLDRQLRADKLGISLTEGQATRDPGIYSDEENAVKEVPEIAQNKIKQNNQLIGALDDTRAEASPNSVQNNARQHGQTAVDQYKLYDEPIKADITAKYKALADANGGTIPIDQSAAWENAQADMRRENVETFLPDKIRSMIENAQEQPFTANTLENFRTRLATAARSATDGNEAHAINLTRNAYEQMPMTGPDAVKFRGLADDARTAARNRFEAIEADPAYEAAVNDYKGTKFVKPGQGSALADTFMNDYVMNAPRADLETMQSKFKDNPDMQEAIAGHALNTLREKAGIRPTENTGEFKQHGYNSALQKMSDKTDLLFSPDTAQRVRDLGQTASDINRAPVGDSINRAKSGILVKAAAAKLAQHAGMSHPLIGLARSFIPDTTNADFAKRALAPGAGLTYKAPK